MNLLASYISIRNLYMPTRDFLVTESVDDLIAESHELGGSAVVVDRATPKASHNIIHLLNLVLISRLHS